LHETVIAGHQHPVLLAGPAGITRSSALVRPISATCTASCPAVFKCGQTGWEAFASRQGPHARRDTGRWYSRTEKAAPAAACWRSPASMNGKSAWICSSGPVMAMTVFNV
jgi:hypothetical protein